jgi:hypothetical protein
MVPENQSFQSAPMGARVIWSTVAAGLITLAVPTFTLVALSAGPHHQAALRSGSWKAVTALLPIFLMVPSFFWQRSKASHFRVEENVLVLGSKRYPLAGLVEVTRDREVLHRARKIWGNGGLGAIRGRFKSKRIGKFDAFLTDTDHAVVLRWPDKTVAVSPADPEFFILIARSAAGLR